MFAVNGIMYLLMYLVGPVFLCLLMMLIGSSVRRNRLSWSIKIELVLFLLCMEDEAMIYFVDLHFENYLLF